LLILSSTKLELRAKQFLPGSEGLGGKGRSWGWKGGWKGGEMIQTLYAHMNIIKKEEVSCQCCPIPQCRRRNPLN
jgi:hypothetical protein